MPERLKAILDKITAWWKKFNTKQRSVLISIVAVVIVALVILGVVISRPTQVELVEAQSASEASTIKGVLEDNNISYEVDSKLVFFVNKSDEVYDYPGSCFGYCQRGNLYYNHYISSAFAYFADCRTYSQYISDSYVNSGADTYICAKNNCNFSCDDALWLMDARHYVRIYD